MKISRKSLIVLAVVLALAVTAVSVTASVPPLYRRSFGVDFTYEGCLVRTEEFATVHPMAVMPGVSEVSTNIGTVTASGRNPCIEQEIPGVGTITVKNGEKMPFTVTDVRDSSGIVAASIATVPILAPHNGKFLNLSVPKKEGKDHIPVQAGANAFLVAVTPPDLVYCGYVYIYTGTTPPNGYLTVPFVATGNPSAGFGIELDPAVVGPTCLP